MLYVKTFHIIFVVTWFAGLFYAVRLFVYFAEAQDAPEPDRTILQRHLRLAQKRLWFGITWPSAVLTAIFGGSMLTWFPLAPWLIAKLALVATLYAYHGVCHVIFRQQQRGEVRVSGHALRLWNEVATLLLFAIVALVVLKGTLELRAAAMWLAGLAAALWIAVIAYRRLRTA